MREAGTLNSRTLMLGRTIPVKSTPAAPAASRRVPACRKFGVGSRLCLILTGPVDTETNASPPSLEIIQAPSKTGAPARELPPLIKKPAATPGGWMGVLKEKAGDVLQAAKGLAASATKNLGIAIADAIRNLREFALKCKGLTFHHMGKLDARWTQKWKTWYDFVRAMCAKPWEAAKAVLARFSAKPLGADARAPFQ